ncbi:MAG TPA: rod shape-determining protein MreD [Burkholderiales bacterium]|jgi:rod shape-determining protein MreD|nr:rod shape-determining protein MreD [Burkholderiales bacterium]
MPAPSQPTQYILLPVNPWFIAFTLVFSLMLNLLPVGRAAWTLAWPDWVALTLVFWNIHQPRRVGLAVAWLLGLVMDVNNASLLGEHALAYSVLSYTAISLHRRVLWFSLPTQMIYVLPLFLAAQLVIMLIRLAVGGGFPGLVYFASAFIATALWPLATYLYLAPQRRPADKDENRPI